MLVFVPLTRISKSLSLPETLVQLDTQVGVVLT